MSKISDICIIILGIGIGLVMGLLIGATPTYDGKPSADEKIQVRADYLCRLTTGTDAQETFSLNNQTLVRCGNGAPVVLKGK